MAELGLEWQAASEKLKNEIVTLNNEIVHLNHMRKMELSQQKIMYEGMLESKSKDHLKDKELLIMQNNITIKKLNNQITALQTALDQVSEHKKIGEIQQNTRELELIENNNKLETQLH